MNKSLLLLILLILIFSIFFYNIMTLNKLTKLGTIIGLLSFLFAVLLTIIGFLQKSHNLLCVSLGLATITLLISIYLHIKPTIPKSGIIVDTSYHWEVLNSADSSK